MLQKPNIAEMKDKLEKEIKQMENETEKMKLNHQGILIKSYSICIFLLIYKFLLKNQILHY